MLSFFMFFVQAHGTLEQDKKEAVKNANVELLKEVGTCFFLPVFKGALSMLVGFSQSQYYLQSAVILAHLFKLFFSI
jgi:hypothetical protein